ncbi:lipopolysaccharide biosynthesis protein [Janibacter sp. YB324]|uniref:lipopolysaccharide biosynthesis protein n=1 Tax=Janibacter sp. YB324 TaxID=2761047 RepID=UPI0016284C1F|nr:lipopolysaccharide biosynthesis protein [Janibacter sp. YB324]QNF93455.1 lipopolysaccharide biosynthesis protein [Janibacter sp. YB324]
MTEGTEQLEPERRRVSEGLISGTVWTAVHVLVSVPIGFLVNVVVARRLGVVDYGQLAILTMVLSLATAAASLGVGAALMQFVTKASESGRRSDVTRTISGAQGYNIFVAAPLVALVVALVVDVPWPLLVAAVVFGVLAPAALQAGPILLSTEHRSDRAAQLAMVSNLGIQTAVVVTVLVHPVATSVWVARIVATGALMALPFLALSPLLRRAAVRPRAPWSLPRAFWAFAVPTGLATLVSTLVTDRVQIFFFQWLGDAVAVGLFALGFGLAAQVLAPVQAMVGPLLPAFAALRERGPGPAREGLLRVTRVSAVVTGGMLVLGVPVIVGLVPWIYGQQYAPSGDYFLVMSCAVGFVVVGSGAYASLMSRLRGRTYLWVNLGSLVVMAGVALALIPPLGAWGGVASMVCGTVTRAQAMTLIEMRSHRIPLRRMTSAQAPVLVATLVVVLAWFGTSGLLQGSPAARGFIVGVVGPLCYLAVLRIAGLGLSPADGDSLVRSVPAPVRAVLAPTLSLVTSART